MRYPRKPAVAAAWTAAAVLAPGALQQGCAPGPDGQAAPVTALTPALHASRFPIATGPHAVDCDSCHGSSDSFKEFDCLGCHTEAAMGPRHATVSGYVYQSASCYSCHPDGTGKIDLTVHAKFFPVNRPGDKHTAIACGSCHLSATDRTQVSCTGCHEHEQAVLARKHSEVGEFQASGGVQPMALCLRCHADSQVDRVAAHKFGITASFKHHLSSCLVCHPSARTDKPFAEDFTQKDCLSCHEHERPRMDDKHKDVGGYSYATASCLACHPQGRKE